MQASVATRCVYIQCSIDRALGRMITTTAWVTILCVLLCAYGSEAYVRGRSSSSGTGYYKTPECESENGVYCSLLVTGFCQDRDLVCTQGYAESYRHPCSYKEDSRCNYYGKVGGVDKFKVTKHATPLAILPSSRTVNPLRCLKYNVLEHHFITYRGLMYEFLDTGARVQDPSDPGYEYRPGARSSKVKEVVGYSSCTYQDVKRLIDLWNQYETYSLCSNNCQDFATGLGRYLTAEDADCTQYATLSDDELAKHISRISTVSDCTSDAVAPLPLTLLTLCVASITGFLV